MHVIIMGMVEAVFKVVNDPQRRAWWRGMLVGPLQRNGGRMHGIATKSRGGDYILTKNTPLDKEHEIWILEVELGSHILKEVDLEVGSTEKEDPIWSWIELSLAPVRLQPSST